MAPPIWNQRIYYELLYHYSLARRWLDLGCGQGTDDSMLIPVRRSMKELIYIGVDLDMCSLKNSKETNRICADVAHLPFPNGSFDLVTSDMVFEHLSDPLAVLKEANRVLGEGGVLIIHTASSRHYMLMAGRLLSGILPRKTYMDLVSRYTGRKKDDIFPTVYRANTARKLSAMASNAGFRAGLIGYLETPLDLPANMQSLEERVRNFLPLGLKSTLLAVYIKREWARASKRF
jgi:ubiquinone/menaquinone biosynthesis C-methylase UbiE